ncbi:MAG: hypothetical protein DI527_07550 [Chelatococcus sp.]|nr:MAG: hypothetical protein DI527_07550 [Chelatococcus sp.]
MIEPILHIRIERRGLISRTVAIGAIAAIFAVAVWTGISLLAAFFFSSLVVLVVREFDETLIKFGSIEDARRHLDEIEREGRR